MTSYGLHGRAALVTGGTRGIGLEVARQLADAGALVCVTARDREDVRRAADELAGIGLAGSVADPVHLRAAVDLVVREFGRLDVVVNNAATNQPYGPLMEVDPDAWREAFTVNVEAPLRLVREAWRVWMREHGGSVVNVCTEGAAHVGPNVGAYGTSKAALLHLTQQLAGELAPRVRVNSVSPGLVRTEMARFVWEKGPVELPLGRIGEPEDIARAVVWLASDAAGWITGADLLVDGGTRVRAAHSGGYAVHDRLRAYGPPDP
ncbi:SDR family oxidoreductase [Streptomyces griseorubiginosus]|uniref:SDR family oxidoreductase n=1 Tax=Streptomyces griseorubiginosus TaxID=67304 RepID=UPI002E7FFC63|nr:SDR family oxidoreductase [Streptomyces griseorubiginosus]WUB42764.1 SDR family oxidoreductase [Streptomyces griseorubiginosus]WUB51283.1 SDR family oxidoreductase [Streptomyces griseorubiginosus]